MPLSVHTGDRFGKLTVLERYDATKYGEVRWLCQCDCGNTKVAKTLNLRNGKTWHCGCSRKTNFKDITNQRFGRLTALYPDHKEHNRFLWKCRCDCGKEPVVDITCLTSGNTRSCGCLRDEVIKQNMAKDIRGEKFGKLTPLYFTGEQIGNKENVWMCRCECGNLTKASVSRLTSGDKLSCGCKVSSGEEIIKRLLTEHNISYVTQKTFEDCIFHDTHYKARFDFYVDEQYIIEFDGEQHFITNKTGWATPECLKRNQEHDKIKNDYCHKHNIPIIRIPYTKRNSLCLRDLLLETSEFIVKENSNDINEKSA